MAGRPACEPVPPAGFAAGSAEPLTLEPTGRRGHIPGEAGVWVFIFGDLTVFAILFGTFVSYRDKTPHAFTRDQRYLHSIFGVGNTLLLLTSSLAVVLGVRCLRRMRVSTDVVAARRARICLSVAILCGVWFLVDKGLEWGLLLSAHHGPSGSDFFTYFFVLTGLHALHVIAGLAVLSVMVALSRRPGLTRGQFIFCEGGACFWHMVDLIWIVLFALLYLAR